MVRLARWLVALVTLVYLLSSGAALPAAARETPRERGVAAERVDLRTRNTKVFQYADGSGYAQVYSGPIHYRAPDGSWQPTDTQLAPLAGGGWATKASDLAVRFQARSTQRTRAQIAAPHTPLVSMTQDTRTVQFEPLNARSAVAQVNGSEITYAGVYDNVDLHYAATPGIVKEALVLHKPPTQQAFSFALRVAGATAQLDAQGGIALTPCADTCWSILPPYMEDANGASSDAVHVALEKLGDGNYLLTYTPDASWLADATRAWPVMLDPTVNTSGGVSTYVQQGYPNSTGANQRYTPVGYDPEGNGKGVTRSFFAVGLPQLPTGSTISNATFNFYQYYRSSAATGYTGEIHRVTTDWASQATNITWNTGQPSVDGAVAASRYVEFANGWKSWNITGLMQQWYSGTPNYGLSLWASPESARGSYFCSVYAAGTQCGTADASQVKPYYTIDYTTPPDNFRPNTPTLIAPADGATTSVAGVTLQVQDAGDPDNGPRNYRDFFFRIEKTDNTWAKESGWGGATWGVTLSAYGSYRWRAMAGDGAAGSEWSAWRTLNYPAPIAVPISQPQPRTNTVPYFSQLDTKWANNKLGACTGVCSKIGPCGCALTSTAMVFKYYGADTDPGRLAACAGNAACELQWGSKQLTNCGQGKVFWVSWPAFSWPALEQNLKSGPVIIQIDSTKNLGWMHFVVVTAGSGSNPANYTINDPGMLNGANRKLSEALARGYRNPPASMRIYGGRTAVTAQRDPLRSWISVPQRQEVRLKPSASEPITGSVTLYENTELTATLQLDATSLSGTVSEMLVWSTNHPSETWQPYSRYASMPLDDFYYVQYRDSNGNTTPVVSTGLIPAGSPPDSTPPTLVFLPLTQQ